MQKLQALVKDISAHAALNNAFYATWMTQKLSIKQIAVFVRNYWEFAYRFPESLAMLLIKTENVAARAEYAKTLYSEMGYGNPTQVHSSLFELFCQELSNQLGNASFLKMDSLKESHSLLVTTNNFINGQKELYSSDSSIAVGAQLALEWQAYTMISKLYEGARNYMDLWPSVDTFHEACEFFYVHIGSAEKEHKEESIIAASKVIDDGGSYEGVEYGYNKHLKLISEFWQGIASEINKL